MINNSALSSSMNVADIAPKAAAKQPETRQGDNAFGEALAGAHTVHDRRESQAAGNARPDQAQVDRTSDRSRSQDRTGEARAANADRADRPDRTAGDDAETTATDAVASNDDSTATSTADSGTSATQSTAASDTDDAAAATTDVDAGEATTETAAAQATVAVAAAPVVADLDAIIVPTSTTVTQVATDAVDAAIRLAIDADAAVAATAATDAATTTPVDAATITTATTAAAADVDADVDAQLAAAIAPGAEDAETGDVQAGPTRPTTSIPATTSGPSPAQLAAATFASSDDEAAEATTTVQSTQQVAASDAVQVATGTTTDAAQAQLVQAAVVETDADAASDAEVVLTDDAAAIAKAGKGDAGATKVTLDAEPEVIVDDADPEVVQAARLNQAQSPTVAVNAQVQAKAAEQAAAKEGETPAPAELEPIPAQAAPVAGTARGDNAAAALRMREGLQAQVQERIDHIAEQLATRLRLSQAAGGSQVQLSLKPRELGEVTVQMNVRDGAVAATILVDKADTLRTLQTNIEDLKRSLEAQGLSIGEFSVDVRGDSGAGGANARAAADLRGNAARTSTGSSSTVAGAAAVTPGLSGDREVDPEDVHDGDVSVLA